MQDLTLSDPDEVKEWLAERKIHPDFYRVAMSFALWVLPLWTVAEGLMAIGRV
jgi:hypothetical protein